MTGIIIVCVVAYALKLKGHSILAWWLMMLMYLLYERDRGKFERERTTPYAGYPIHELVKPKKYKFMFSGRDAVERGIPKERYYYKVVIFWGFCIFTVLGMVTAMINQKIAIIMFFSYIPFTAIVAIITGIMRRKKEFQFYFKKLNFKNFIYLLTELKWPSRKKIGKCKIVSEYSKGKAVYVTVEMLDDEVIQEGVLFSGTRKQGKNPTYTLYEICKVFYII